MRGDKFGSSQDIVDEEYQEKEFNCDSSIPDSVKQTVAELDSKKTTSYCISQ